MRKGVAEGGRGALRGQMMRIELFEVQVPKQQMHCSCGHPIGVYDFQIDDPQEVRAICAQCHAELLRITWGNAVQVRSQTGLFDQERTRT